MTVVGIIGAVRQPCDHWTNGVHPVCIHGGNVLTCCDGYVCACRGTGGVAREGRVGGFEDGIVGYPFALDHPVCRVLRRFVAVGIVAEMSVNEGTPDCVKQVRTLDTTHRQLCNSVRRRALKCDELLCQQLWRKLATS
jgi:hypothetical protein